MGILQYHECDWLLAFQTRLDAKTPLVGPKQGLQGHHILRRAPGASSSQRTFGICRSRVFASLHAPNGCMFLGFLQELVLKALLDLRYTADLEEERLRAILIKALVAFTWPEELQCDQGSDEFIRNSEIHKTSKPHDASFSCCTREIF